ncbi:MAG TPA: UDP-N-acetylglucosamine 2-epimerase (non-hydrolyzing) [Thermotogota bacterium]|nr:UDP-N-acetylglucosamine 2-epimerase (non-hydrolyzing) [Thermotogota bacterium]HNT95596.1 UDP-N-acetylglucosamine 2-epimerase (non-hydrolyzing) [Thermotogota bacterium]HOZ11902.1 UDP-N-acetylglucosamine 2-epimerase (non-hydrolyzing) [Thermotogota bacterium]HPH10262.1 UDP-N-acetylglucosamine 2-epimerase (non-hydrolyzing) [Thermotogota bacterium]HPM20409.1 UDP-N-acetylglucosamine 2-epimerase (non-hydrolyzing) [Thermotogota bacterium]
MRIGLIFGTRPEAIKMAPVYLEFISRGYQVSVIATAQHRQMLDQVLQLFGIKPDIDLDVMTERQTLSGLTARLCRSLGEVFERDPCDVVLVQGDTTSTFVGALAAFYHKIPVGHVEAGLRTSNRYNPFPEEINRRLTTQLSSWHFAPTEYSRELLLKEQVDPAKVFITGNTVIDALQWVVTHKRKEIEKIPEHYALEKGSYLLVTLHRRENWGEKITAVCHTLLRILNACPDLKVFFPVHLNPRVREIVFPVLQNHPRVILSDPVEYIDFVGLMAGSKIILSDSGGIQEEAPSLGKPVLVLRETTERPEAVEAGTALLTGTDPDRIYERAMTLLSDREAYDRMSRIANPFGSGNAAKKIVDIIGSTV